MMNLELFLQNGKSPPLFPAGGASPSGVSRPEKKREIDIIQGN
jgi:hypothetical protein